MRTKYSIGQPVLKTEPYEFGIIVEIDRKNRIAPYVVEWFYSEAYNLKKYGAVLQKSKLTVNRIKKYVENYSSYLQKIKPL